MKSFTELDLDKFQKSYEQIMLNQETRLLYCPKKTSIHMTKENNTDVTYMNTMPALIDENTSFVKTIYVDLKSSKNTIEDILYIHKGKAIRKTNIGLTPYRCGIIVNLVLRYLSLRENSKVGFLGTGTINKIIAKSIDKWNKQVVRFGIQNRSKNKETFDYFNKIKETDYNISDCNVVISCTNNTDTKYMLSENNFKNVKCLIALDGGCIFDKTTRETRIMFSDHVEQLKDVYMNEFPFDTSIPVNIHQLSKDLVNYEKSFVNLYGIAFADAILFNQLLEQGDIND